MISRLELLQDYGHSPTKKPRTGMINIVESANEDLKVRSGSHQLEVKEMKHDQA